MPIVNQDILCVSEMADHFVLCDTIYRERKGSIGKYDRQTKNWSHVRQLVPQGRLFALGTLEKDGTGYFHYAINNTKGGVRVLRACTSDDLRSDKSLGVLPANLQLLRELNSENLLAYAYANGSATSEKCSFYAVNEQSSLKLQQDKIDINCNQLFSGCLLNGNLLLLYWNVDPATGHYNMQLIRRNLDGSDTLVVPTKLNCISLPSENTKTRWVASSDGTMVYGVVLCQMLVVVDLETLEHEIIALSENDRREFRVKGVMSDGQLLISAALRMDDQGEKDERLELILIKLKPTLQETCRLQQEHIFRLEQQVKNLQDSEERTRKKMESVVLAKRRLESFMVKLENDE